MLSKSAIKITLIYLLVGFSWIYFSDRILFIFFEYQEEERHILLQTIKGGFYVIVTGIMLYALIRSFYKKNEYRLLDLEAKQAELKAIRSITKTAAWEYDSIKKQSSWTVEAIDIFDVDTNFIPTFDKLTSFLINEIDKKIVLEAIQEAEKNGKAFDMNFPIVSGAGEHKWIRIVGNPEFKNKRCVRIYGTIQDITKSKNAEVNIIRLNRLYSFITSLNQLIVRTTDEKSLLKELCDIAVTIGQFRMVWVGLYNAETGFIEPYVFSGVEKDYLKGIQISVMQDQVDGRGPSGTAFREGRHFVVNDIESDINFVPWREAALSRGYKSSISLPYRKMGTIVGTLNFYTPIKYYFDDQEIKLLNRAAIDLSFALDNIHNEETKKAAEDKLEKSENLYRAIVETTNEGVWMIDENGFSVFENRRMEEMLGYQPGEMRGRHLFSFMDEEQRQIAVKNIEDRKNGIAEIQEFKFLRKDGTFLWVMMNTSPFIEASKYSGALAMITDITKRKLAEERMLEALERYEIVSKATSDTIWDWDVAKNSIKYTQGIAKVFEYTEATISNTKSWRDSKIHPADLPVLENQFSNAFSEKLEKFTAEYRFKSFNGEYRIASDRLFITYNQEGQPIRVIGSMQDITAQKEFEMKIDKAVINTQEVERQQIGMELHDNVNQILAASLIYLGITKETFKKNNLSTDIADRTESYIQSAIDEIRRLSHELAPVSIKDISINQVIELLVDTINLNNKFEVKMEIQDFGDEILKDEIKINLYRILQEQLNNIIKYSQATLVTISLKKLDKYAVLAVSDNGVGFDSLKKSNGIGLENIRRRAKLFSGEFKLFTSPGTGCKIIVEIPLTEF